MVNKQVKHFWVFQLQTKFKREHKRPDITVVDNVSRKCSLADDACAEDQIIVVKKAAEKWGIFVGYGYSHSPPNHW